jgi:RNA polymerase sigma-70 factor (ECF subfamily)
MLICGDYSLAQDLAQETFAEAWKCLRRYDGRCHFFTWLCAILHNRYRNYARRKRLFSLLPFALHDRGKERDFFEEQPDQGLLPDQATQAREQAELIRRCIHNLPAKQQQVIYLRFFVDDSLEGIAAAIPCSLGTVKSRLFHALERLRRMSILQEECGSLHSNPEVL